MSSGVALTHSSDKRPDPRERLLAGEPLVFEETEPESERTIEAAWLEEAVGLKRPIVVVHGVIAGETNFSDRAFTESTEFIQCRFVEVADFRRAEFPRLLNLNGTEFLNGATFAGARFRGDVLMGWARFRSGTADFGDAAFEGQAYAYGVRFARNVVANFIRTSFDRLAYFRRAAFGGRAQLFGARCGGHLDLYRAYFADDVDCDNLIVAGNALFAEARFRGRSPAGFRLLQVDGQALFNSVTFGGGADFRNCRLASAAFRDVTSQGALSFAGGEVSNSLDLSRSTFGHPTPEEPVVLRLDGARIVKDAFLGRIKVDGDLQAVGVHVGQQLNCGDAQIGGKADFFETIVDQGAYFNGTVFESDVTFHSARFERLSFEKSSGEEGRAATFKGNAGFAGVVADQLLLVDADFSAATAGVFFDSAKIGRRADFSGATFAGWVAFDAASFAGECKFNSTRFTSDGLRPSFQDAMFARGLQCREAVFAGGATLAHATFGGKALFRARFEAPVTFDGCQFEGHADFSSPDDAVDDGGATIPLAYGDAAGGPGSEFTSLSMCNVRCRGQLRLQRARFSGALNLQGSELTGLFLPVHGASRDDTRLPATIDLRRCRFEQIAVDWRSFRLARGVAAWWRSPVGRPGRVEPYDRASYARLEAAFRKTGDDRIANRIHLERRRIERERMLRRPREWGSWLLSLFYLLIANYGVRPVRLLAYTIVLLTIGTIYFSQPGTVEPKDDSENPQPTLAAGHQLTPPEAFGVTLNYFLPGNVPLSAEWRPVAHGPVGVTVARRKFFVDMNPATLATIMKVCGWILVPFGIGAITGVLRRTQVA